MYNVLVFALLLGQFDRNGATGTGSFLPLSGTLHAAELQRRPITVSSGKAQIPDY